MVLDRGGGSFVKLADVTSVSISTGSDPTSLYNTLKWKDPDDVIISGTSGQGTFAEWAGTIVVRKKNEIPSSISDGVVVIDSKVRNQYQNTGFVDRTGLEELTTYYYRFFPYSTTNVTREGQYVNTTTQFEYVSWVTSSDSQVATAIQRAQNGLINLYNDYGWRPGDVRKVNISAMSPIYNQSDNGVGSYTGSYGAQQNIDMMLIAKFDNSLVSNSGITAEENKTPSFLVGFTTPLNGHENNFCNCCIEPANLSYGGSYSDADYYFSYASHNAMSFKTSYDYLYNKINYQSGGGYYGSNLRKTLNNLYEHIPSYLQSSIIRRKYTQDIPVYNGTTNLEKMFRNNGSYGANVTVFSSQNITYYDYFFSPTNYFNGAPTEYKQALYNNCISSSKAIICGLSSDPPLMSGGNGGYSKVFSCGHNNSARLAQDDYTYSSGNPSYLLGKKNSAGTIYSDQTDTGSGTGTIFGYINALITKKYNNAIFNYSDISYNNYYTSVNVMNTSTVSIYPVFII